MATAEESLTYEPLLDRDGVKVSKSPWGPDDEIGRLNWITPETNQAILEHLDGAHVFDLNVEYFIGMPSWVAAGDPPYGIWMTHTPDGSVNDNLSGVGSRVHKKYSYCGDSIHLYTHCGTHIDTLNHLGHYGTFWNGWTADKQLGSRIWNKGGPEKYPPGIALAAAKWLCEEAGAMCIGADTIALEVLPSEEPDVFLPVHAYMFSTAGAQIIEVVDMEEIAAEKQYEFAFLGFPLKLRGATGAPMPSYAVPLKS